MHINDAWDKFWNKRGELTKREKTPFLKNFLVMEHIINTSMPAFSGYNWKGMHVCEVGAGRGTMSDFFNARGAVTHCCDLKDRLTHSDHYFESCDINYETPFSKGDQKFDLVFTYGLMEHFSFDQRFSSTLRMIDMLKDGGMLIHYVVPKKWTNILEDRTVPRFDCSEYKDQMFGYGSEVWRRKDVYPVFGGTWLCDEFFSKGFFIYTVKGGS